MDLLQDIIEGEVIFPRRFAGVERRDYGILYHTDEIPDSYDGNHAHILHADDPAAAIADVEDFSASRGLDPRVNHVCRRGEGKALRTALQSAGFEFMDQENLFYVHRHPSGITPTGQLSVGRVQSPDDALLEVIRASNNARQMNVVRQSLSCDDYHLLVGFLDERPVAMASVELAGRVCRVDDVLTHVPFRGRGYCREVIDELVRYHSRVLGGVLCLYTDNPSAARIYEQAGFEKLDGTIECWSAWKPYGR
jgi:ribosomal protein S18 acetylase RimI-like enzyme